MLMSFLVYAAEGYGIGSWLLVNITFFAMIKVLRLFDSQLTTTNMHVDIFMAIFPLLFFMDVIQWLAAAEGWCDVHP